MKTMTAEQIKKTRDHLFKFLAKWNAKEVKVFDRRKKLLEQFLERATEEFQRIHGKRFWDFRKKYEAALEQFYAEIRELERRCPENRLHKEPAGRYYRCDICGFKWDDTPPKHF